MGQFFPLGDDGNLTLAGNFEGHRFNHYDGLNNFDAGASVNYKTKLGLGVTAPWLRLYGSGTRLEFNNNVRDGWLYRSGIAIGKRFDERWSTALDLLFEKRTADETKRLLPNFSGAVFDQIGHSLLFSANYLCGNSTALSFEYGWRSGDIAATTKPSYGIYSASTAIAEDSVFGADEYAYKLHAISRSFGLGISKDLSQHSSLNLKYQRRLAYGTNDFNYYNSIVTANYLYNY